MGGVAREIVGVLRAAREAKDIRQSALAHTVGISPAHLSRIESGKITPTLATLQQIARVLDLEIMLVPRQSVPAVRAMSSRSKANGEAAPPGAGRAAELAQPGAPPPAYRLGEEGDDE
ncbi:helix-turn-helix domain-containing protein [Maricaulis sp.]|uniref:helix-turn-helix domain-containing protein n=1 Tax=Maricaulis sp. TaxID=1486257 RepID=UPI003A94B24A